MVLAGDSGRGKRQGERGADCTRPGLSLSGRVWRRLAGLVLAAAASATRSI